GTITALRAKVKELEDEVAWLKKQLAGRGAAPAGPEGQDDEEVRAVRQGARGLVRGPSVTTESGGRGPLRATVLGVPEDGPGCLRGSGAPRPDPGPRPVVPPASGASRNVA